MDPLGAALLEGTLPEAAGPPPANVSSSASVDGNVSCSASVNTSVSINGGGGGGGGGVSVDALLGQQMQSLQAESRVRVAPLLVELETVASQAADLHARKQALLLELQVCDLPPFTSLHISPTHPLAL